ncbi:hypothetical protein AB3Z07_06160 [Metabacillus halosaccharovorans]
MIIKCIRIAIMIVLLISPIFNIENQKFDLNIEDTSITSFSINNDMKVALPSVPKLVNEKHKPSFVLHTHIFPIFEYLIIENCCDYFVETIPQKMSFLYEVKYHSNFFA